MAAAVVMAASRWPTSLFPALYPSSLCWAFPGENNLVTLDIPSSSALRRDLSVILVLFILGGKSPRWLWCTCALDLEMDIAAYIC